MTPRRGGASTPPWWQLPALIVGIGTALGVLGTVIVNTASWISLPDRVEAGERRNAEQDKLLERLTIIQEQNHQLIQAQRPTPSTVTDPIQETDADGVRWCCGTTREDCWARQIWTRCGP